MDPNATYQDMLAAQDEADYEQAQELAMALHRWLMRGGAAPDGRLAGDIVDECARVRWTCRRVLQEISVPKEGVAS